MRICRAVACLTIAVAPAFIAPASALAGGLAVENITVVDSFGNVGVMPKLVFGTIPGRTTQKFNELVYVDQTTSQISSARRQVDLDDALAGAAWTVQQATNGPVVGETLYDPDLAVDPIYGTPYVTYSRFVAQGITTRAELTSYVGAGAGNCGTVLAWECEDIVTACGLPQPEHWTTDARVEVEARFGYAADAVHIMFNLDDRPWHARKDLATHTWTCQAIPGAYHSPYAWRSIAIRHVQDDRVKPQLMYRAFQFSQDPAALPAVIVRSLLDYSGTPLPPLSWTGEDLVFESKGYHFGGYDLELVDDGMSYPAPKRTGFGVPAIAMIRGKTFSLDSDHTTHCDFGPEEPYPMEYRQALDAVGVQWAAPQLVYEGDPCSPSLEIGWNRRPFIAFTEEPADDLMLVTQHEGTQFWDTPDFLAPDAADPSLAFDYEDASLAIAYYDRMGQDLVVIDGWWSE